MKKRFLTTVLFFLSTITFLVAQVPERMTYQAVLRDAQNHLVTNSQVGMQISILHNSPNGVAVYMERHTVTTNAHGLVTVEIGTGQVVAGSISAIQWGSGYYYIQTEIDLNGGTLYTLNGVNPMLTVPYAFHAKTAGTLTNPPAETDPIFTAWNKDYYDLINRPIIPTLVSSFQNDVPYLITETDPLFSASVAAGITSTDTFYWNHLLDSVSLTETDPLFTASVAAGITSADTFYWNHLLDSVSLTETDPLFTASVAAGITSADTFYWNHLLDSVSLTETQNLDSVLILGNDAGAKQIKNLQDPTDPQDAVTKIFLENFASLRVGNCDTLFLGDSQWIIIPGISVPNGMLNIPVVITASISNILQISATSGGTVTSDGNTTVTARGVCWSTSPNPTLSDSYTTDGTGLGAFTSSINGLTANTTYYVRAYATNSVGTVYGNEESFTTLPPTCSDGVTDIDGNHYDGVQIGTQCWMKQNLRVTKYANGTSITLDGSTSSSTPYRYYPNGNASNVSTYGYLYNWPAAMNGATTSSSNPSGIQGVCPAGWHLPSDAEWTELTNYLGGESVAGGKLKETGTTHWASPNTGATNETGFTALPGGFRYNSGAFDLIGNNGYWWSATEGSATSAWYRDVYYNDSNVARYYGNKEVGFSVRCLRD